MTNLEQGLLTISILIVSFYSSCVVCMNEFEVNELIKRLDPCKHDFHSSCIDPWLKVSRIRNNLL